MVLTHEVMRSRTLSIPWHISERGNGSRERKHRMQEQQQPTARQVQVVQRVLSAVPHTRARLGSRHTHRSARAGSSHTHSRRAFGSSLTHTGRTYGGLWQQEPHTRWARLLQQPHMHTSRYCPAASHPRARAIPSNRWSSRRAFSEVGSRQAHIVMREAGTRARAHAHAHVPSVHRQPSPATFTRRAP
jgi:hypothetical protein